MIDDAHLSEIASSLEDDSADARTRITPCNSLQIVAVTANRAGFLRLAASCLRAAVAPIRGNECRSTPVELLDPHQQVVEGDSDLVIAYLQRMETMPEPNDFINACNQRALKNDGWALLTCGVISTILLAIVIAGITTIAGWFR